MTGGEEGKGGEAESQNEERMKAGREPGQEHCWCRDEPQTEVDSSKEARKVAQMSMSLKRRHWRKLKEFLF